MSVYNYYKQEYFSRWDKKVMEVVFERAFYSPAQKSRACGEWKPCFRFFKKFL